MRNSLRSGVPAQSYLCPVDPIGHLPSDGAAAKVATKGYSRMNVSHGMRIATATHNYQEVVN
jgi:hypothetical protein